MPLHFCVWDGSDHEVSAVLSVQVARFAILEVGPPAPVDYNRDLASFTSGPNRGPTTISSSSSLLDERFQKEAHTEKEAVARGKHRSLLNGVPPEMDILYLNEELPRAFNRDHFGAGRFHFRSQAFRGHQPTALTSA